MMILARRYSFSLVCSRLRKGEDLHGRVSGQDLCKTEKKFRTLIVKQAVFSAGTPSSNPEPVEKKKTEIIVEADEMEDGSIFVCFMCEKEFNKVSLLNHHMQLHQNMPVMHKELPSKRRGRGKPGGRSVRGRGNGQGREPPVQVQIKEEPIDSTIYIKTEPSDMFSLSPVKRAERISQQIEREVVISLSKVNVTTLRESHHSTPEARIKWVDYSERLRKKTHLGN
ncbi:hypothetical protein GWK47_023659 [Chionoecetes opilio]|uniref:C2H2-type domain-containing protein n=1 Tax=Chionoecetes opilio TaxID=41210 RepID=A0A8J4XLM0_CHIOP|nr:hypothetical protein GWK47_023659 [Chionoecetes opilio]